MEKRIKHIRSHFNLTQQEFADRLKIKRNTIAKYETGRGEPIDAVIALICREFNINESWLRTGDGEMLKQLTPDEELAKFFATLSFGGDSFQKRLISVMSRLDEEDWKTLEKLARELAEK